MTASPEERRLARTGALLLAPAVLVLLVVAAYPIVSAFSMSMHREVLVFREHRFIGLDNWRFLVTDPRFHAALGHTVYFAFVAVTLELVLGLGFALLLHRRSGERAQGQGLLRAAVLVPWAVPTVVSGKLWAWMFDPDHGLITRVLSQIDAGRDVNLLGAPLRALHASIVVDVWKTTPFVALILLAGLQSIPEDVYRAARVDGATAFRTFRSITLPLLRETIAVAAIFRLLDAIRVFDAIYVLTEGGPANGTETLSIYAYKTMMRLGDFGYGSTLSLSTFLFALVLAIVWQRVRARGAARGAA